MTKYDTLAPSKIPLTKILTVLRWSGGWKVPIHSNGKGPPWLRKKKRWLWVREACCEVKRKYCILFVVILVKFQSIFFKRVYFIIYKNYISCVCECLQIIKSQWLSKLECHSNMSGSRSRCDVTFILELTNILLREHAYTEFSLMRM